ncbi:MAG: hypothetical protein H6922_04795 [Pseudomonadaceae bacterium]|nr:hypothetical protein [Pseudomonadaceae bacterium]
MAQIFDFKLYQSLNSALSSTAAFGGQGQPTKPTPLKTNAEIVFFPGVRYDPSPKAPTTDTAPTALPKPKHDYLDLV